MLFVSFFVGRDVGGTNNALSFKLALTSRLLCPSQGSITLESLSDCVEASEGAIFVPA